MTSVNKRELSHIQQDDLLKTLQSRFKKNLDRHEGIEWDRVEERLKRYPEKMWTLNEMERTGGEPDIVFYDEQTDQYVFYDCSPESPKGRRSHCYDREGLEARKEYKPLSNAIDMAAEVGIEILTEEEYRGLQKLGNFDSKTSSWVRTPAEIRQLGGALFMDFRYNRVFVYHNSAPSYYSSRGFRGSLRV